MFFRLFHSQPGNGPRVSLPIFSLTKKNSFLVELNITTSLCPKHLVLSSLLINGILFASPTTFRGDVRQVHECSFTHSPKGNIPTFKRSKHFDKCSQILEHNPQSQYQRPLQAASCLLCFCAMGLSPRWCFLFHP